MAKSLRGVTLEEVVAALHRIAPLELAEEWDNVGLLIEPTRARPIRRVLLTIDLTDEVSEESLSRAADLVVAYHPPIFHPLRRLAASDPGSRPVLRLIEAGTAVYSPHTAADAAPGGVNDWLADGLGRGVRRAISRPRGPLPLAVDRPVPDRRGVPIVGQGRLLALDKPASLDTLVRRVKRHLGLSRVRVAAAKPHAEGAKIGRIALCAGAGSEVIQGEDADLLLTGEMRHHDVRSANARGRSVVLCEHTNTERCYLPRLREKLLDASSRPTRGGRSSAAIDVVISAFDRDPLEVR